MSPFSQVNVANAWARPQLSNPSKMDCLNCRNATSFPHPNVLSGTMLFGLIGSGHSRDEDQTEQYPQGN